MWSARLRPALPSNRIHARLRGPQRHYFCPVFSVGCITWRKVTCAPTHSLFQTDSTKEPLIQLHPQHLIHWHPHLRCFCVTRIQAMFSAQTQRWNFDSMAYNFYRLFQILKRKRIGKNTSGANSAGEAALLRTQINSSDSTTLAAQSLRLHQDS